MVKKIGRYVYLGVAVLFIAGILTQVYLVGLSLLGGRPSWDDHVGLGFVLGYLTILLIILSYVGRQPRSLKILSWISLLIYTVLDMILFLRDSVPLAAALHPVVGATLFAVTAAIVVQAWRSARETGQAPAGAEAEAARA